MHLWNISETHSSKTNQHSVTRWTHTTVPTAWRTCHHQRPGSRRTDAAVVSTAPAVSTHCPLGLRWPSLGRLCRTLLQVETPRWRASSPRRCTTCPASTVGGLPEMLEYQINLLVSLKSLFFFFFFVRQCSQVGIYLKTRVFF